MKRPILIAVAVLILIVGGAIFFLLRPDPVEKRFDELRNSPIPSRAVNENALADLKYKDLGEGGVSLEDLTFDQIVALLRKKYGAQLQHPYLRVRMIEELLRFLKMKYPDTWVQMLQEILGAAFPNEARALFDLSEKLYKYNKYMEENESKLSRMTDEERRSALWGMRHSLFGEEAEQIWQGERANEKVADALKKLRDSTGVSPEDKLKSYQAALQGAYGTALPGLMENHRQTYVNSFIDAVQEDLTGMNSGERTAFLRDIRETMGMDDAALSRWDKLDSDRDQRWSNGELYMQERKDLTAKYSGEEREQKLDELRKKLFGEEAESIKNEESGGYFRFGQKRRYGRE